VISVTSCQLTLFRSYTKLVLEDLPASSIILCGPNGAGKTNILEAISLLSPGRGLRGSRSPEIQNSSVPAHQGWSISAKLDTSFGSTQIGVGLDQTTQKKLIRINGEAAKSQTALSEWVSCIWLTPQMDRLFIDSSSHARRFFDRLIFTFDPGHAGRITRYENAASQRLKLLKEGNYDPIWLSGLESQMAEAGIAISTARDLFCKKLQKAYLSATQEESDNFPIAVLSIEGEFESKTDLMTALDAEEFFKKQLKTLRDKDAQSGITHIGPHRALFNVIHEKKSMNAALCSTGEQKLLLIGIILAHARLLDTEHGTAPLLLLDEVVAHLDPNRRAALAYILNAYPSQIWMTGTDQELFGDFASFSDFFLVRDSEVTRLTDLSP
jgi:DNA replication and repair protein RecF